MSPTSPDQANSAPGLMGELANASPQNQRTYWQQQLDQYVKQTDGKFDSSGHRTPLTPAELTALQQKIGYAREQVASLDKQIQESATNATAQQRADTTAANDAAARAEQARHNQATEGAANRTAQDTVDYHNASLGIQGQLAQISAQNEAIRAKAEQDTAAAKGDANKIALARLQYEQGMAAQTAKLQTLKDQVTSLSSIDNTGTTEAVNQANNRNTSALTFLNGANNNMTELAKLGAGAGQPGMYADAMKGLLSTAPAFSQSMGGGAVPVGQLTDQHKAEITQLVMAGMPFAQAVQQTAARASGQMGDVPYNTGYTTPGGTNPLQPSHAPAGGFSVNSSSPSAEQANSTYAGGH